MAMERPAGTSTPGIHLEGGVRERSEIAYLHLPLGLSKIERFGLEGKLAPQLRHNCQSTAPQLFRSCPAKPRPLNRISGFALDTSARQSKEKSFSLFSLLLLSLNRTLASP